MIIILDDTFNIRHKYNDIEFLEDTRYKNICKIYEVPTNKDFRDILFNIKNIKLVASHRSLKLFNDKNEAIDGQKYIESFLLQVQSHNIPSLIFGRDMHSNLEAKTLNKDIFYHNLKSFLDFYLESNKIELRSLFYGKEYEELEYLKKVNSLMNQINISDISTYKENTTIIEGVRLLFSNQDPLAVIDEWITKGFVKKEILSLINNQL